MTTQRSSPLAASHTVLHVVGDSKFGGGSKIILTLAESAKAAGFSVDVLTTDCTLQQALRDAGIGVVALPAIWRDIRPLRDLVGLIRLTRYLKTHRYSIVHTHTSKAGFVGRLAAKIAKVPVIVHTVHGFAFHEQSSSGAVAAYTFLERLAARWCDRIVTVSRFHRDWALRLAIADASKLICIQNGILPQRPVDLTRDRFRESLGVRAEEILILTLGRLAPQKGLEYLIDAARLLETALSVPFRVIVAGDGPLGARLEKEAADAGARRRIDFVGFRDDVPELLDATDIVALPTQREGLSIALLEAMAAGKPIVTTTIGSNREVCEPSQCAVLIPPKSAEALAKALAELIQSPARAAELGNRARLAFEENYTAVKMAASYIDLYVELLVQRHLASAGAIASNGLPERAKTESARH